MQLRALLEISMIDGCTLSVTSRQFHHVQTFEFGLTYTFSHFFGMLLSSSHIDFKCLIVISLIFIVHRQYFLGFILLSFSISINSSIVFFQSQVIFAGSLLTTE